MSYSKEEELALYERFARVLEKFRLSDPVAFAKLEKIIIKDINENK